MFVADVGSNAHSAEVRTTEEAPRNLEHSGFASIVLQP